MAPGQRPERYSLTYYPGVFEAGEAEAIALRRGQTLSDLRLPVRKSPLFSVSGSITRKPSDSARLIAALMTAESGMSASASVAGDMFRIESVAPGSYALVVLELSSGASASIRLASQQPVQLAAGDIEGLGVDLDPSAGVHGTLGGMPAGAKLRVLLSPLDFSMPYSAQAEVKADGSFAIPGSFAGRFRLQVEGLPADAYIKSAVYGKKDALDPLELARTGGDEKLEIVLSAGAARISGVVRDDKGKALDGTVTLIPDPQRPRQTSLYQLAETDENGRFQFQGLRPGSYRLYAWEEFEAGAQFDPEITAPFQARSVAVEVAEGGRKSVAVTRISVEEVETARKPL